LKSEGAEIDENAVDTNKIFVIINKSNPNTK
jgi:hypothetical protein